jgi:hypothetical protein
MSTPSARRHWRRSGGDRPQLNSWNVLLAGRFPDYDIDDFHVKIRTDFDIGTFQNVNVIIRTS